MQVLWLSVVALGMMPRPACYYADTLPLTSLADVRAAIPAGTYFRNAEDAMSLRGFVCVRKKYWSAGYGNTVAFTFGTTKYLECIKSDRTERGIERTIQIRLMIVGDKVAHVDFLATYNWPSNSKWVRNPATFGRNPPYGAPMFIPQVVQPSGFQAPRETDAASK